MTQQATDSAPELARTATSAAFPFRPWVRRAGASIVWTAAALTAVIVAMRIVVPSSRYGWLGEPFVWVYVGTLWIGGAKVWLGTRRNIVEIGEATITLRPLHQFRSRLVRWSDLRGTEQMLGGDRLIVYFDTPRGLRFVALNLNLVKGRRELLAMLDARLRALGCEEKLVERSRYLTRRQSPSDPAAGTSSSIPASPRR